MSNKGESVILPSNAVFLVHKVGSSKPGREIQWETRSKTMRAAPDPTPLATVSTSSTKSVKAKSEAADGASWEFVSYTPRKDQQLARRPKDKRKRRNEGSSISPKERSVVPVRQQPQPKLSLSPNPSANLPDLPVTLVGHALLYINFCMPLYHLIIAPQNN